MTDNKNKIETEFGTFEVRDLRSPGSHSVVSLHTESREFTVNRKTYHGTLEFERYNWGLSLRAYVGWNESLTDSAREKLRAALEPVIEANYPPLTRTEVLERLIQSVYNQTLAKLGYEIEGIVTSEVRKARDEIELTDDERAELHVSMLDAVQDWLNQHKA